MERFFLEIDVGCQIWRKMHILDLLHISICQQLAIFMVAASHTHTKSRYHRISGHEGRKCGYLQWPQFRWLKLDVIQISAKIMAVIYVWLSGLSANTSILGSCLAQSPTGYRKRTAQISMICLCSKYVKNCNIFGQILNIWVKLILRIFFVFFFNI